MSRRRLALVLLALCGSANAGPTECDPLDAAGFRDLALLLRSGVDRGDDALVAKVVGDFDERLPCLVFAPDPHAWADVLVLRSIGAYANGGDWQTPMTTALRIWPGVDRVVSSRHPLASWEPPEAPTNGPTAEPRARLYVDGLPVDHLPPADSLALVQRTDGSWWNSVVVTPEAPLPDGWASAPVVPPPHIATRVSASLGLVTALRHQHPDFDSDWMQTVEPADAPLASFGGVTDLVVTFYSPFGLLVSGSGWLLGKSPGLDLHAAGVWAPRHLVLGLGAGTASVETVEGPLDNSRLAVQSGVGETQRLYMLRYATALARVRWGDRTRWQLGLLGGGSANLTRWSADAEIALPRGLGGARWLIGLGASTVEGRFEQVGAGPGRSLSAGSTRGWLSVGRAWGEDG